MSELVEVHGHTYETYLTFPLSEWKRIDDELVECPNCHCDVCAADMRCEECFAGVGE